jgi:hypothetical protein
VSLQAYALWVELTHGFSMSGTGDPKKPLRLVPENWGEFFLAVLFQGLVPLAPLLFEQINKGMVTNASVLIASAIYTISIGLSSRNKLVFGTSIAAMLLLSYMHGLSASSPFSSPYYHWTGIVCIGLFFIAIVFSKFNEHVIENKKFWVFH